MFSMMKNVFCLKHGIVLVFFPFLCGRLQPKKGKDGDLKGVLSAVEFTFSLQLYYVITFVVIK
jgi:hypothetical protein